MLKAAQRADVEGKVAPHWLRHAHATHALERGVPIHLVQATLGHASVGDDWPVSPCAADRQLSALHVGLMSSHMTTNHELLHPIDEEKALVAVGTVELARGEYFTLDELRCKLALSASDQCR